MQLEDVLMRLKIIIKPVPTIGMGAPHPYCRINCEKLVGRMAEKSFIYFIIESNR